MGIPPSTFHNLPLMSQAEIQQYLKQQLKDEFHKRNQIANRTQGGSNPNQSNGTVQQQMQSFYEYANQGPPPHGHQ